jgi:hypothetical protein
VPVFCGGAAELAQWPPLIAECNRAARVNDGDVPKVTCRTTLGAAPASANDGADVVPLDIFDVAQLGPDAPLVEHGYPHGP